MPNPLNEKAPLHSAASLNTVDAPPATEEQVMEAPHPVEEAEEAETNEPPEGSPD